MNCRVLLLAAGAALAGVPGTADGGDHQLFCGQPVGGLVVSTSENHQLIATIDWPVGGGIHRSENFRLLSGCNGARFDREFFDWLFRDQFRHALP